MYIHTYKHMHTYVVLDMCVNIHSPLNFYFWMGMPFSKKWAASGTMSFNCGLGCSFPVNTSSFLSKKFRSLELTGVQDLSPEDVNIDK